MIFESTRQRKLIKQQFNYWLKEAKTAKERFNENAANGDYITYHYYKQRYVWCVEGATTYANKMGETGGYGIVLRDKMEEQIKKLKKNV